MPLKISLSFPILSLNLYFLFILQLKVFLGYMQFLTARAIWKQLSFRTEGPKENLPIRHLKIIYDYLFFMKFPREHAKFSYMLGLL